MKDCFNKNLGCEKGLQSRELRFGIIYNTEVRVEFFDVWFKG